MGKAKKVKKGAREDDSDEDSVVESQVVCDENVAGKDRDKKAKSKLIDDIQDDDESDSTLKKKKGKDDKKKRRGDDSGEEYGLETTSSGKVKSIKKQTKKGVKSRADESSDEEQTSLSIRSTKPAPVDSDDDIRPSKPVKSKKNKGFSLLMDDSESHSEPEELDRPDIDDNKKTNKKKAARSNSIEDDADTETRKDDRTTNKKGKKGKKKKDEDDEEDIEKMLAELALEYSGGKKEEVEQTVVEEVQVETSKKVKTKGKEISIKTSVPTDSIKAEVIDGVELEGTIKSAAQKKKEKKEREKQKKLAQKKQEPLKKQDSTEADMSEEASLKPKPTEKEETEVAPVDAKDFDEEEDDDKKKKKKKKGEEDKKEKGKGPNKKMIAAMQEALKKVKEEEEKFARDEEERIKREEEADKAREEAIRLEAERKEKKKQREKEKKERLKAEGKLLTAKQKADRARAQAMLDALKAKGLDMPNVGEKKAPRPGTRVRGKSKIQTNNVDEEIQPAKPQTEDGQKVEVEIIDKDDKEELKEIEEDEVEGVKDAWDAESSGGDEDEDETADEPIKTAEKTIKTVEKPPLKSPSKPAAKSKQITEETVSSESSSDEDSDESEEEEDHRTDAEKKREKALARIHKRRIDAEKGKTLDDLRAAVVCVLGHVDTGKTKILDKLRRTNVQDGEAGGITQQIGATNVPIDAIKEQTKVVRGFADYLMKIPGLLIIDTPGHESFSNLRSRGSSLCDIAILVVDIMHGLEPQTLESINLLKSKKTPFVVALNKIDRLYDWQTMARKDVRDVIKSQAANTQLEFEQRTKEVIVQFAEQGLNASLFYENPDVRSYVSLVPTSAITGEGIPNLLALVVDSCQTMLAKRLMYSEDLQATVLEVKAIPGLGTTVDAILINGRLREGDTMVLAGTDGPIVTQIRSLLMPQPMKELRVKNAYVEYKEIQAAQGVKIAAKELEKAIAGLNLQVAQKPDEVEILRDEVAKELRQALSNIKLKERGVYVQASTLGSLEALLEFLKTSKIPYANIRIGPVVKKDVMKASTMLEHDSQFATILAFDVKVEKDAQEMADTLGVRIFQADIIYHLFDKFMAYREELRQRKREEFKHIAVFPCKLKVLPQYVFNSRDPIVMGVMVEAGVVREGTPVCVPTREFVELGVIRSVEVNKKAVENARKGQEVCIKIEAIPGEAPKMFGRHFDETDFIVSKISRQSIDACKDYFRDDLIKADWELMVELKKQFEIL